VVPHITDAVQDWIERVAHIPVDNSARVPDVCVIELGGTVGDIESMPFVEALRQFQFRVGKDNFCLIHVSLVPVLGVVGEQKTKPTQHSVQVRRHLVVVRCSPYALRGEPLARIARLPTNKQTSRKPLFSHPITPQARSERFASGPHARTRKRLVYSSYTIER
jgi:CTP synthase (UTP-ammonia lyase)